MAQTIIGRPNKGDRRPFTLRLPVAQIERIAALDVPVRADWIIDAIERKLNQEETENGRETETG